MNSGFLGFKKKKKKKLFEEEQKDHLGYGFAPFAAQNAQPPLINYPGIKLVRLELQSVGRHKYQPLPLTPTLLPIVMVMTQARTRRKGFIDPRDVDAIISQEQVEHDEDQLH